MGLFDWTSLKTAGKQVLGADVADKSLQAKLSMVGSNHDGVQSSQW